MTKVVLEDSAIVAALDAVESRSELCDASGRVLGYFVRKLDEKPIVYRGAKSPFPREELERRLREEKDRAIPLAQFWEQMRIKHPDKFQ